jgi:hypothetical protein
MLDKLSKGRRSGTHTSSPYLSAASYHLYSTLDWTCERSKSGQLFCEELSIPLICVVAGTRIIQPVTVVDGNRTAAQTGPGLPGVARRPFVWRSFIWQSLFALIALSLIAYVADYCVFRYRVSANRQPFGTVTVEHYDAVAHKDGKAELIFDPPVQQTCVHALFPHAGNPPCWYLSRHAEQRTDI